MSLGSCNEAGSKIEEWGSSCRSRRLLWLLDCRRAFARPSTRAKGDFPMNAGSIRNSRYYGRQLAFLTRVKEVRVHLREPCRLATEVKTGRGPPSRLGMLMLPFFQTPMPKGESTKIVSPQGRRDWVDAVAPDPQSASLRSRAGKTSAPERLPCTPARSSGRRIVRECQSANTLSGKPGKVTVTATSRMPCNHVQGIRSVESRAPFRVTVRGSAPIKNPSM